MLYNNFYEKPLRLASFYKRRFTWMNEVPQVKSELLIHPHSFSYRLHLIKMDENKRMFELVVGHGHRHANTIFIAWVQSKMLELPWGKSPKLVLSNGFTSALLLGREIFLQNCFFPTSILIWAAEVNHFSDVSINGSPSLSSTIKNEMSNFV